MKTPAANGIRAGFGEGLLRAAQADKRVVALCADLSESTGLMPFKNKFPERFIELGVAEQNLAAVASGMAAMGKIPFMASFAIFSPGRNWEQIRTTICYNNLPVKIVSTHAGINVGPDGGSHQALEDIAMMRALPRMTVISPCDGNEAEKAAIAAAKTNKPTYIRLAREKGEMITVDSTPFDIGKASVVFGDKHINADIDVGIIATGILISQALAAAKKLEQEGKKVVVMNLSTIKPLDESAVIALAHKARAIVTVEDHQIYGGMGSAVAECLAVNYPVPMEFVGVRDKFGQSGDYAELMELYGLTDKHIYNAVKKVLLRK